MKTEHYEIEFAGSPMWLLPSGAVYSPAHSALWVADVHLGKAASYRRLGQPVPQGTTTATLAQLSSDIKTHQVDRLIVLGDFLHGPLVHRSASTQAAIEQWRMRHRDCEITLIRGNHDDRAGDPANNLDIAVVDEPFEYASIACCHDDHGAPVPKNMCAMSGHVHPVVVVRGKARDRMRLPCFVVSSQRMLLPAYGQFTGGHVYEPKTGESVFVIADQSVYRLPATKTSGSKSV